MGLSRRSSQRVTANIWPGFVDAVTSLLMVMTFVLTILIVVQYVLREEISGQETQLDDLNLELTNLARALGAATDRADRLAGERDALTAESERQGGVIRSLRGRLDEQSSRIAGFEEQVASLLATREEDRARIADLRSEQDALEAREAELLTEQEALNLALAQARDEVDAAAEEARLAAARREALQALIADLEQDSERVATLEDSVTASDARIASLEAQLSDEEAARLAEAAAAEALRERLQDSDAELTAMSLALEEERREAEETLTLLAAAEAAQADLNDRLLAALRTQNDLETELADTRDGADRSTALLQDALSQQDAQARELASISDALEAAKAARQAFQGDLEDGRAALAAAEAEISRLRTEAGREADERDQLAAELAAAQSEARALEAARGMQADLRAQLEEALALKLEAENRAQEQLSETERRDALLATARDRLAEEEQISDARQREVAALNAQVSELRDQLGTLQALLDAAEEADAENEAQIETLGAELNAALAREALEQRRRAELEAAERQRLENYQSEFFGRLREVLGDREGVQIVGDRFVFSSEVLFPSGSADLSPAGREQVRRVANLLEEVADEIPDNIDWVIRVDGHTDDVPLSNTAEFADNWELSQARALSVVRFMADDLGFPEWRLAPTGFGDNRPVDPRTTPEARAANRRIELKLTER